VSALGLARDLAPEPSTAERKRQEAADDFAQAQTDEPIPEAVVDALDALYPNWMRRVQGWIEARELERLTTKAARDAIGNCDPEGMN
jgi:hypothetical protein